MKIFLITVFMFSMVKAHALSCEAVVKKDLSKLEVGRVLI